MDGTTESRSPKEPDPAARPSGEHDEFSFARLSVEYNLLKISSYGRVFCNLILDEINQRSKSSDGTSSDGTSCNVLDVGCGHGIGRRVSLQREIRQKCGEYWGIEPDQGVTVEDGLFDNFQHALMETAEVPENYFDVVYSSMVMEHVEYPDAFLQAVQRCLKPGGVHLFLTPNAKSFVPWVTRICHSLHIDEFVLRLVRKSQQIDEYHYPVQFRCNTPQQVTEHAFPLGFLEPEFAYIEGNGSRGYFPGPLRLVYAGLMLKRKLIRNPRNLVTMICRLTKAK
ncbi:MAG: class I SAM-dependent methyltransferase [Bythopirellula sp.]